MVKALKLADKILMARIQNEVIQLYSFQSTQLTAQYVNLPAHVTAFRPSSDYNLLQPEMRL
jgi:hypothetical protein